MAKHIDTVHAALLAAGWVLSSSEDLIEDDYIARVYKGSATLQTDGSGLYGVAEGEAVEINCITFVWTDGGDSWDVGIDHTYKEIDDDEAARSGVERKMLYTDSGIEEGVSSLIGVYVNFTEQGMQNDYYMSME